MVLADSTNAVVKVDSVLLQDLGELENLICQSHNSSLDQSTYEDPGAKKLRGVHQKAGKMKERSSTASGSLI